jgi:hypothetical protein
MQIYIHRNNEQLGPFTEADIQAQLAAGTLSLLDNVWWEGQAGWIPLGQSPFAIAAAPVSPVETPTTSYPIGNTLLTSKLAIWALVCGCLSLFCSLFASIPAIILGHMGLTEIKKNPAIQGRGLALAGMILGYIFTTLIVLYIICILVLVAMGTQVNGIFKTINAQLHAAQTNSVNESTMDQATTPPASTNATDQSTNSAPATTSGGDQTTNSAPASTNSMDSTPSTNAPASSTNAAPATQ